jgi:hypothetical protein
MVAVSEKEWRRSFPDVVRNRSATLILFLIFWLRGTTRQKKNIIKIADVDDNTVPAESGPAAPLATDVAPVAAAPSAAPAAPANKRGGLCGCCAGFFGGGGAAPPEEKAGLLANQQSAAVQPPLPSVMNPLGFGTTRTPAAAESRPSSAGGGGGGGHGVARDTPLHQAARKGNEALVRQLIAQGANVKAKDSSGYSPLHWAAFRDRVKICEILMEAGANINSKNHFDNTPLILAAWHGRVKVLQLLVENGALVNHQGESGNTALHYCARAGDLKTVQKLVEQYEADPTITNSVNKRPLDVATKKVAKYLKSVTDARMATGGGGH